MEIDEITRKHLRAARAALRWTQHEMATLLGASVRQLQRWERGQSPLPGPLRLAVILLMHVKHREWNGMGWVRDE